MSEVEGRKSHLEPEKGESQGREWEREDKKEKEEGRNSGGKKESIGRLQWLDPRSLHHLAPKSLSN